MNVPFFFCLWRRLDQRRGVNVPHVSRGRNVDDFELRDVCGGGKAAIQRYFSNEKGMFHNFGGDIAHACEETNGNRQIEVSGMGMMHFRANVQGDRT
jgi:hypothetical protein